MLQWATHDFKSSLFLPDFGHLHFRCTCRQGRCHTSFGPGWVGIVECSEDISVCIVGDCMGMIARRHKVVAGQVVRSRTTPSLLSLGDRARGAQLAGIAGPPGPEDNKAGRHAKWVARGKRSVWNNSFERALLRSQSGAWSRFLSVSVRRFSECFCCVASVFPSLSRRFCRCGRLKAGVLGRRGFALESVAAHIACAVLVAPESRQNVRP